MTVYQVLLSRGAVALVDADDLPLVEPYSWHLCVGKNHT